MQARSQHAICAGWHLEGVAVERLITSLRANPRLHLAQRSLCVPWSLLPNEPGDAINAKVKEHLKTFLRVLRVPQKALVRAVVQHPEWEEEQGVDAKPLVALVDQLPGVRDGHDEVLKRNN